ncbi:MAG: PD40 domain-containing protein [Alphaproteobacteria bacterium]|nr:PD40 domain-containing protein [Alphaproteobacteria bacterium]
MRTIIDRRTALAGGAAVAAGLMLPGRAAAQSGASVSLLIENAGHLDWKKSGDEKIAFDRRAIDTYFDVWLANSDGSGQVDFTTPLSGGLNGLPLLKHKGCPAFHPGGEWIAFQAQKPFLPSHLDLYANPGAGLLNDLWVARQNGTGLKKIFDIPGGFLTNINALLHPHFNHAGNKVYWAQRIANSDTSDMGKWVLKIGDFNEANPQLITDPLVIDPFPGEDHFYESHGFSPDDQHILFTVGSAGNFDIWRMRLSDGELENLTPASDGVWDEHSIYSPDGSKIVWGSSQGLTWQEGLFFDLETEFWLMDADGSNKTQLTYFSTPGHPHNAAIGNPQYPNISACADSAWNAAGTQFVGLVITGNPLTLQRGTGPIVKVTLP